jgi:hypothetical protein
MNDVPLQLFDPRLGQPKLTVETLGRAEIELAEPGPPARRGDDDREPRPLPRPSVTLVVPLRGRHTGPAPRTLLAIACRKRTGAQSAPTYGFGSE